MGGVSNLRTILAVFLLVAATAATLARGQGVRFNFYRRSCPRVESIVRSTIRSHVRSNPRIAPNLLRMHFHDCFVRGCDGSVLISGSNSERTAIPNRGLLGFDAIEDAKTRLERDCPRTVSCADILTLAARDSVVLTGGRSWRVPLGRRDGNVSIASEVRNLPGPSDSVPVQRQKFSDKGLNDRDLVVLVAGHTIGTAGCGVFRTRFFNFNGTGRPDPSIDPSFVPRIQALCPLNGDASRRVALDTGSVDRFDTSFLKNVRNGRGILQSDQVLWGDPSTRRIIQRLLRGGRGAFNKAFGRSMIKMSRIEVKTATEGEIRRVCSAVN